MNQVHEDGAARDERGPEVPRRKRVVKIILAVFVVFLVASQFVPVNRGNPPVASDISAPAEVKAVLKRSCYGCHSHETVWPWYSYVAPVSWLVAYDVGEGREELNFSAWDRYDREKQQKKIRECWEEVEEGEMPLWFYLPLHPDARLSEDDREVLRGWARDAGGESAVSDGDHGEEDDSDSHPSDTDH